MKKIVRLTESDLVRLVKRVIKEQSGPISNVQACIAKNFTKKQIQERIDKLTLALSNNYYVPVKPTDKIPNTVTTKYADAAPNWIYGVKTTNGSFIYDNGKKDSPYGRDYKVVYLDKRWTDKCPVVHMNGGLGYKSFFLMDDASFQDLLGKL